MRFDLDILETQPVAVETHGEKLVSLLNLEDHPRKLPFAMVEKKLFGAKGEVFTTDRHISFKANGGLSKLKKQQAVSYSDVTGLEFNQASTWLEWTFRASTGSFKVGLIFYGKVKGIAPRNIFWYEKEAFPKRSGAFYRLISEVIPRTGLTTGLDPSSVRRRLDDSLEFFLGNRTLEDIGMTEVLGRNLQPRYAAVQHALCTYLAATTLANDDNRESYLDIFEKLDSVFASMLDRLREELLVTQGGVFTGDSQINAAGEKFERLSSIWYFRQIAGLHFAFEHLPQERRRPWPISVVKPRARTGMRNNRQTVSIQLPKPEDFDEAIGRLRG